MIILVDGVRYNPLKPIDDFKEVELERVIQSNAHHIFGPDSFYFDIKRKIKSSSGVGSIPDAYVILFDPNPRWCILEVELSAHSAYDHVIPQLTKFKRAIEDSASRKQIIEMLYEMIKADSVLEAQIRKCLKSGEIYKFVSDLISEKPIIVVAIDEKTAQLEEALGDIAIDIKVLEFKMFRREAVSGAVNAYIFDPIVGHRSAAPIIKSDEPTKVVDRNTILPVGLRLHSIYKGKTFTAEIVAGGKIKLHLDNKIYGSLSWAAVAAIRSTGSSRGTENGWTWWKYIDPKTNQEMPIDVLREE
jgi:Restriction Enzyme Adenine Methylase Associated